MVGMYRKALLFTCAALLALLAFAVLTSAEGRHPQDTPTDVTQPPEGADVPPVPKIIARFSWLKPQYVLGEDCHFMVGMKAEGDKARLPDPDPPWRLLVHCPDGSTIERESTRRLDGMVQPQSLAVGCGFDTDAAGPGVYRMELHVDGAEPVEAQTEVIKWDLADQVTTEFVFPDNPQVGPDIHTPVIFRVHNGTDRRVAFPIRGYPMIGLVWVSFTRQEPRGHWSLLYPNEALLPEGQEPFTSSRDRFTWGNLKHIPHTTVEPGQTFEQEIALERVYDEDFVPEPETQYEVTISTKLQLQIGSELDEHADACPVRRPVYARVIANEDP